MIKKANILERLTCSATCDAAGFTSDCKQIWSNSNHLYCEQISCARKKTAYIVCSGIRRNVKHANDVIAVGTSNSYDIIAVKLGVLL